ncbi:MAG: glycosyltransferase [Cytophagaceae bacterium]|nr:glycosyltransferase [Cytophagaceae bacterium]
MMDYLYYFLLVILASYLSMTMVIFVVLARVKGKERRVKSEERKVKSEEWIVKSEKKVSVLIAARNEEDNIIRCLQALVDQNYPKDKIQILVGDDDSDDKTASLVKAFIVKHPHIELVSIEPSALSNLKGKPNVLATLFKKVTGEFAFITDADISVNPDWIKGMLLGLQREGADAASGTTFVAHQNNFHLFQTFEWMEALGFMYTADQLHLQVTAVGNNMVISKAAYDAVGGYEAIPFSVTEDLDLYLALKKKNYIHRLFLGAEALVWTQPLDTFKDLFKQRKRWLKGVERTPWLCQFYLGVHSVFALFIVALGCFDLLDGICLFFFSFIIHIVRVYLMCKVTGVPFKNSWLSHLLILDIYQTIFNVCLLVYFVLPTGVEWKKRRYV